MSARGPDRPADLLAAGAGSARPRSKQRVRGAALALAIAAGLGAWASAIAGTPASASAQSAGPQGGGPQGEAGGTGEAGSPSAKANAPSCPSPNPPNQLTLVGGTPQTALLGAAFAGALQVALSNSNGCAVTGTAGVAVTFTAPAGGAGGVFSTSDSNTVTVGADASGNTSAPTFTANYTQGSYTVIASSPYGAVSFSLTNAAAKGTWCPTLGRLVSGSAGPPVKLTAGVGSTQATRVGTGFPVSLAVTVTDAQGNPAAGALVRFSAPVRGASGRFVERSSSSGRAARKTRRRRGRASRGRGARVSRHRRSHVHLHRAVEVRTDACGIAVAPPFVANRVQGGYVVRATIGHAAQAAFALVNEAR